MSVCCECCVSSREILSTMVRRCWMFVVNFVCCQVEVSATSSTPVQRNPNDYGSSLLDVCRDFVCCQVEVSATS